MPGVLPSPQPSPPTTSGEWGTTRIRFPLAEFFRPVTAVALLAGATAVQMLSTLPPRWIDALLALAAIALILIFRRARWIGFFLLAASWTVWRADIALSQRLPHALEGADVMVSGQVHGLPRAQDDATRFEFDVGSATHDGTAIPIPGRLRLAWYDTKTSAAPDIAPCSNWQLHVRLKRPRGGVNPGGFDFERYALEAGIVATGYVRESGGNRESGSAMFCVDRLRERIGNAIDATLGDTHSAHLLRALAFGDQHAMGEREWAVARATGAPVWQNNASASACMAASSASGTDNQSSHGTAPKPPGADGARASASRIVLPSTGCSAMPIRRRKKAQFRDRMRHRILHDRMRRRAYAGPRGGSEARCAYCAASRGQFASARAMRPEISTSSRLRARYSSSSA